MSLENKLMKDVIQNINQKNYNLAEIKIKKIIRKDKKNIESKRILAIIYAMQNKNQQALEHIKKTIESYPNDEIIRNIEGNVLTAVGQYADAIKSYDVAIAINPSYVEPWSNKGNVLYKQNKLENSLICFNKALSINSNYAEAWSNKAITLHALKRFSEALVHFDKALLLNPNFSDAWSNKALTLYKLNRYTEALSCLDQAILLNPENTMAWTNKGVLFIDLKKYYEAEECFKTAQKIDSSFILAKKNIYQLNLYLKKFTNGWKDYESRWLETKPLQTKKPAWLGEKSNSRIFIWGEQGVGDQILYSSMLNELKLFPQKKILSVNKKLLPIFRRSFSGFTFLDKEEIVSEDMYDEQLPLGSLGQFFRRSVKDFESSQFPYLCDDKKRTATILEKLQYLKNIKCGISWRSSNQEFGDHKSIGLLDLIPLFRRPGFSFINLQYGDIYDELDKFNQNHNIDISKVDGIDLFEDVDGVLSIIQACDIVITVSNSTAHLAGALGKKTYLLLSGGAGKFWYWHRQGEKSLWYPSIKIFEQKTVGDWTGVIDEVLDSLEKECVN